MKILLFAFAALVCSVIWIGFLSSQMEDKDRCSECASIFPADKS